MKRTVAFVLRHARTLLAVAVLVVPVALVAPSWVQGELHRANGEMQVYYYPDPLVAGLQYNAALAVGIVEHVPSHVSVATVGANLAGDGMRWMAYVIAPRQLTDAKARWTIVLGETPKHAGFRPRRSWRYGADWLVER